MTLYGYARDPSAPDGGAGASVPQQRPAEPLGDEPDFPAASNEATAGTAAAPHRGDGSGSGYAAPNVYAPADGGGSRSPYASPDAGPAYASPDPGAAYASPDAGVAYASPDDVGSRWTAGGAPPWGTAPAGGGPDLWGETGDAQEAEPSWGTGPGRAGAGGTDLWGETGGTQVPGAEPSWGTDPSGTGSWASDPGGSGSWPAGSGGTGSWATDPGGSGSWASDAGGPGAQPAGGSWTASGSWRVPAEDTGDQRSGAWADASGRSHGPGFDPLPSDPGGFEAFRADPGGPEARRSGPGDFDPFRSDPGGFDSAGADPAESTGWRAAEGGPGYQPDPGSYPPPTQLPASVDGYPLPQRGSYAATEFDGYPPSGGYPDPGSYQATGADSQAPGPFPGYPSAPAGGYPDPDPSGFQAFRPDLGGYPSSPSDPGGFAAVGPDPVEHRDSVGFDPFAPEPTTTGYRDAINAPGRYGPDPYAPRVGDLGADDPAGYDPSGYDSGAGDSGTYRPASHDRGAGEASWPEQPSHRGGFQPPSLDPPGHPPARYDPDRSGPTGVEAGRSEGRESEAAWPGPRASDAARWDPDKVESGSASGRGAPEPGTGWDLAVPTAATGATVGGAAFIGFGPLGDAPRTGNIYGTGSARSVGTSGASGTGAPAGAVDPVHEAAVAWASQAEVVGLEAPEILPWDRRPLMVVLAAGAVLVLVAILAGAITSQLFAPEPAGWQPPRPRPSAGKPGPAPTTGSLAPPVGGDTVTLAGVGDVIMGTEPNKLPPANGNGFFDPVKGSLAADLVMGNLETALTVDTGRTKCPADSTGCFQFYLPPAYADYLRAGGFSLMNLANNHTNDMGPQGLTNTRRALEAAGLQHTGAPNEITYVDVKSVKVAVLGFAVYSWGQNLNNIPAAVKLVEKAAANADLVVIQMQGGAEGADKNHVVAGHELYLGEDRGDLIAFSHAVIDAGADVVFGHGPHVMRGMEFYKGRLIAYSLGNFCGYGVLNSAGYLGVGGVLKVSLHRDGSWAGGQLIATEMIKGGMVGLDPARRALAFVDGLSEEDFGQAGASITPADGTIVARA